MAQLTFIYEDKLLALDPLRGEIDVTNSGFRVGKVKIEIWLAKKSALRWGGLVGDVDAGELNLLLQMLTTAKVEQSLSRHQHISRTPNSIYLYTHRPHRSAPFQKA